MSDEDHANSGPRPHESETVRRLAAIVCMDVAGYTNLMGQDEVGTLNAVTSLFREVILPTVTRHSGRVVKRTGDGFLAEFASVVAGVLCSIEIQRLVAERAEGVPDARRVALRVGINLGDIIIEDGDIYGDGVNLAARLETFCQPGEISVSHVVYDQVRDKIGGLLLEDRGEQKFKNIARPIRVYSIAPADARVYVQSRQPGAEATMASSDTGSPPASPAGENARSRAGALGIAAGLAVLVLAGGSYLVMRGQTSASAPVADAKTQPAKRIGALHVLRPQTGSACAQMAMEGGEMQRDVAPDGPLPAADRAMCGIEWVPDSASGARFDMSETLRRSSLRIQQVVAQKSRIVVLFRAQPPEGRFELSLLGAEGQMLETRAVEIR